MPLTQPLDESHDGEWEWAGLVLRACTADGSNRDEEMGQLRAERDDAVERSEYLRVQVQELCDELKQVRQAADHETLRVQDSSESVQELRMELEAVRAQATALEEQTRQRNANWMLDEYAS